MGQTEKKIVIDFDFNTSETISNLQSLKDDVDLVLRHLKEKSCCGCVSTIDIAKKYNLPYGSDLSFLLTLVIQDNK